MCFVFFQAEDGIRDLVRSRGLGDVYKRQLQGSVFGGAYSSGGTIRGAGLFLMHDITACADNGSGLIRVTTKSKHGFVEGQRVAIEGVVGCKEANGVWTVTLVDANNFDLQDSTFTNAYIRGGLVSDRWPAICGFSDERLYFGGSYKKPLSMFLSKPGDYYNFTIASADADAAIEYPVSYTHLRAHETVLELVCSLLLEKKKQTQHNEIQYIL